MGLPKIGTARAEKLGVSVVSDVVFRPQHEGGLGFVYRNQPEVDVGIDGHIEIINQDTDEATGKIIGVQVKGGPSFFANRTGDGWTVYIRKSTVHYWREYAVPVVLTTIDTEQNVVYWVLVSEGDFEETDESYKIVVPEVQRLDASAARAFEQLAMQAPAQLQEKLRALTAEVSDATAAELERHRLAWRKGRRADTRAWLAGILGAPAQLNAIDPVVAAGVLRYAAATTLDEGGDVELARAWANEARRRDPAGDDLRIRASLLGRDNDVAGALALLADSSNTGAQIMRASILRHLGQYDAATQVLDAIAPTTDVDIADVWRIRAALRVAAGDLPNALEYIARAEAYAPRLAQVRLLRTILTYLSGLIPEALPEDLTWPQPILDEFLCRDAAAMRHFSTAADGFRELLNLDWSVVEKRHIEAWRLAALCACPAAHERAAAYAQEVLSRDPAQPYVLLWAASEQLLEDATPYLDALAAEIDDTKDVGVALVYAAARATFGEDAALGDWLDAWHNRFSEAGAGEQWALWRARAYITNGDAANARSLLPRLQLEAARTVDVELLAAEARRTGDTSALSARFETLARELDDPQFLLRACQEHGRAGRWAAVLPHVDELLARIPTPAALRLAIYALYNTRDFAGCGALLNTALARPDEGLDALDLRRMRGDVRLRTGDYIGAIDDLQAVVAQLGQHPLAKDLLGLARAQFFAGHTHELAASARQLRRHGDLDAAESLMLCEMLVHDDPALAREFWYIANANGIADRDVSAALGLGYQLGLDTQLRVLHTRMMTLAEAGSASVEQVTVDELLVRHQDWLEQRERVLDLYRAGDTATHMVAQFLNEPLVHLYHVIPAANEEQSTLRHQFPLQFRDGGRGLANATAEVAAPGRLALDLSGLLMAAHLGILPEIEAQFAPVQLPHLAIAALRQQRGKLKPHQPSRLEITHLLLAAERRRYLRPWEGELPSLAPGERDAAGNWWKWLALLERGRLETAFVLDLPLGMESSHGRPAIVAGPERLERLVTVADIMRFLRENGVVGPNSRAHGNAEQFPTLIADREEPNDQLNEEQFGRSEQSSEPSARRPPLVRGAVVYMTKAGAEALASSDLLAAAAAALTLLVDPADQDARRAHIDWLPELEQHVNWLEDLIRRVSDGLYDGRYALLPASDLDNAGQAAPMHARQAFATNAALQPSALEPPDGQVPHQKGEREIAATTVETAAATEVDTAVPDESHEELLERIRHDVAPGDVTHQRPSLEGENEDEENDRELSLVLRNLADLVSLPPGTVDAVWVDDRFINRHSFAGTARLTDLMEVLAALESTGRISAARRWAFILQLRSANVRILPLSAAEIVYHLRAAPLTNGAVVETTALRILRQYAAAMLLDANTLRIPTPDQMANGDVGELEVIRSYASAVREALFEIWRSGRGQTSAAAQARAEAQSSWLIGNLYLDLGLLRARTFAANTSPESGVSAVDAASLLLSAIQLLSSGDVLQGGPHDALAAAYSTWVYQTVVAPRASRDSAFRAALTKHLRALFREWSERDKTDDVQRAVGRVLAGRTFDALPKELRDDLADDATFMGIIGREITSTLTVGRWHVATAAFANAGAELLAREPSTNIGQKPTAADDRTYRLDSSRSDAPDTHGGGLAIPVLESEPPLTLMLSTTGANAFALTSPDGREAIHLRDAAFGVMAAHEPARRATCEALRRDVDIGVVEWRRITDDIVALADPAARLEALTEYRAHALRLRYEEMSTRWRAKHRINSDDLRPPSPEAVLRHLRIDVGIIEPSELATDAVDRFDSEMWETAARILIDEEGIDDAFDRLAGVPVHMPNAVRVALASMTEEAQRTFVRRVLRTATSPLGLVHLLRVLTWLGATDTRYYRLARRIVRHLLTPSFQTEVTLLRLVAAEASAELKSYAVAGIRTDDTGAGTDIERRAAERLVASWFHAHRFVQAACASGANLSGLVEWLEGRAEQSVGGLFEQDDKLHDLADPATMRPARFVIAALQYATDGSSLLNGAGALIEELQSFATHNTADTRIPHVDLLRDLRRHPNVLGAWLQPTRTADGAISVSTVQVVPPGYAPETMLEEALTHLEGDATDPGPWLTLEIVLGSDILADAEAERFDKATDARDKTSLLVDLGQVAVMAASRLARQSQNLTDRRRRSLLREELLAVEATVRGSEPQSLQKPPSGSADDELTEVQLAVLQALYLLAQSDGSAAEAMAVFAEDLATLARTDTAYLRRVRAVLERLVMERPLVEAHACTGLLLEARAL